MAPPPPRERRGHDHSSRSATARGAARLDPRPARRDGRAPRDRGRVSSGWPGAGRGSACAGRRRSSSTPSRACSSRWRRGRSGRRATRSSRSAWPRRRSSRCRRSTSRASRRARCAAARPVTAFEVVQGAVAVLLGLRRRDARARARTACRRAAPARSRSLLGVLCYGAAFVGRRAPAGPGPQLLPVLDGGRAADAGGNGAPRDRGPRWPSRGSLLGLAAAWLGRRFGRMTLRVHAALYLRGGRAAHGPRRRRAPARWAASASVALPPLAWVAASRRSRPGPCSRPIRGAPRAGAARAPQLLLAAARRPRRRQGRAGRAVAAAGRAARRRTPRRRRSCARPCSPRSRSASPSAPARLGLAELRLARLPGRRARRPEAADAGPAPGPPGDARREPRPVRPRARARCRGSRRSASSVAELRTSAVRDGRHPMPMVRAARLEAVAGERGGPFPVMLLHRPRMSAPPRPHCDFDPDDLHTRLRIRVPGRVDAITPAVEQVMAEARPWSARSGKEFEIETALREALANAIRHGCRNDETKSVEVCVACDETRGMLIVVRDPGPGFDPGEIPSPTIGHERLPPPRARDLPDQPADGRGLVRQERHRDPDAQALGGRPARADPVMQRVVASTGAGEGPQQVHLARPAVLRQDAERQEASADSARGPDRPCPRRAVAVRRSGAKAPREEHL